MLLKARVMVLLVGLLISALHLEAYGVKNCRETWCPAGEYLRSDCECDKCSEDFFTSSSNKERQCHPCFRDCKSELHMQVEKPCTAVSDVVCSCMTGFICHSKDSVSKQCNRCEPGRLHAATNSTTNPPSITSATLPTPGRSTADAPQLWAVVVVVFGILVNVIIFTLLFCRLVKRCSLGNQKEDHDATSPVCKEPHTQDFMTSNTFNSIRPDSPAHHASSPEQPLPPAGNLGPLHIYGAGTVFVSLLNQFGQNRGEKDEEDVRHQASDPREEHRLRSPSLPLSMEERSRDECYVSFPSQEQGKECHVSKEEGL